MTETTIPLLNPQISYRKHLLSAIVALTLLMWGCKTDNPPGPDPGPFPPEEVPNICLYENNIYIYDIKGIPAGVTFDAIKAEIKGYDWGVIETAGTTYANGKATLRLPASFDDEKLIKVIRDGNTDYTGFWEASSDNKNARVAEFGDFIAYNGDKRVGRIYLTDWAEGSRESKYFVYYHYANEPFTLSSYSPSYRYAASFAAGWNAYATLWPGSGKTLITTDIAEDMSLLWQFESWVY